MVIFYNITVNVTVNVLKEHLDAVSNSTIFSRGEMVNECN